MRYTNTTADMSELVSRDIGNFVFYVGITVVVWVAVFVLMSLVLGESLSNSVVTGFFGGLTFGVVGWYLQNRDD